MKPIVSATVCVALLLLVAAAPPDGDIRARDIVSRMTLDEKLTELHGIRDATHYRYVPGIPRLGIPPLQITNGPAGVGPGGAGPQPKATALPAPIALAATWDTAVAKMYGRVVGLEARRLGNGLVEGPTINIARVPQNGRTFEGFGEDPVLTGAISVGYVDGVQSEHVIADVKHFAANNQETDRRAVNEIIDERALREIYLPAFEESAKRAGAVMCAYPKVNGTYCCEHAGLMNGVLKKEWAFRGFVTSDFHATHSSADAALAGLDLEMPEGDWFGERLKKDVESGKVPVSVIDDKLVRRFRTMMEIGVWDDVPVTTTLPAAEDGAIARRIAAEGIVLLKNEGVLPLRAANLKSVALIGPAAMKAVTGGGGSSHVRPLYTVDPAEGIRRMLNANATLTLVDGSDVQLAVDAAIHAEVAIVMIGDHDREGHDQSLRLPGNQDRLAAAVIAANPRTIVVLKTGSAVLLPWANAAPAIVEAWYPGEEDGNAVADVLFGRVNPSGKLPITFPRRVDDTLAADRRQYPGVQKTVTYSEGVLVGTRGYDARGIEPRFPFGFGLSYTTFAFANLRVSLPTVELDVANTGPVAGSEVVQIYVGSPKKLAAFEKVEIEAGKSVHVRLTLPERALEQWDVKAHRWMRSPAPNPIMAGPSSRELPLAAQVTVPQ